MNQNGVIFGALTVGFLVYVTIKGELPQYVSVFTKSSKKNNANTKQLEPGAPSLTIDSSGFGNSYYNLAGASNPADLLFGNVTGHYWNGMPSYNTAQGLLGQAQANVNSGAAGL